VQLTTKIASKIKGGILLEPLVAVVIISAVLTYATFTMNNIFMGKNSYLKFKALIQLEELIATSNDLENDHYHYDTFTISKSIKKSDLAYDVVEITWEIKEQKTNRILGTLKELKQK
jgi:Tfp pilus assembly protein PilV